MIWMTHFYNILIINIKILNMKIKVGTKGCQSTFLVDVKIVSEKTRDVEVTPIKGSGTIWVYRKSLIK